VCAALGRTLGGLDVSPADVVAAWHIGPTPWFWRTSSAALEAARGSFRDAAAAIGRACGVRIGMRQVEGLAASTAVDVDAFYATHAPEPAPDGDVLVLSFDAKGVVMRPDGLRAATAKAAASQKLATRLSKGEKTSLGRTTRRTRRSRRGGVGCSRRRGRPGRQG
jgi:hypothetical protein